MSIKIKQWHFNPGLWPTAGLVLLLPILLSLGFWQLDRAEQKRVRHETFTQRQSADSVELNVDKMLRSNSDDFIWRPVTIIGVFNEDIQILLDNQVVDTKAGYFVFTPLSIQGETRQILVNRGWVPAGDDRSQVPELTKTDVEITIKAVIKGTPPAGITLKNLPPEKMMDGIYRVHSIDVAELSGLFGQELFDTILRLERGSDHGYIRKWPVPGSGEAKHLGYAFQWFTMALALLVIYLVVNIKKTEQSGNGQ